MGLNIENERVHALAREAARVTGKSQTSAIEEALVLLLDHYGTSTEDSDRQRRFDALIALSAASRPSDAAFGVDDLYDPHTGLPA